VERTPTLYVVASPSGGGKTSLIVGLLRLDSRVSLSVSYTTRPARPGEVNGKHYHFIDEDTFHRLIRDGALLEYAMVYGHHYGTGRAAVEEELRNGRDVLLDIDWQGAQQIRSTFPACCTIYILPPSLDELRRRLQQRGQDNAEIIAQRMAKARSEIAHWEEFDFVVINDDFDAALADLHAIIRERNPVRRDLSDRIAPLLAELLENE
jgi:guanylate kinase